MPDEIPTSSDARSELYARQIRVISALKTGKTPQDFDAEAFSIASASLAVKRLHSARKSWPALAEAIGDSYEKQFAEYARLHPSAPATGPRADAGSFAFWLRGQCRLPDAAKIELVAARLSRRCPIRFAWLRSPAQIHVLVKIARGRFYRIVVPLVPRFLSARRGRRSSTGPELTRDARLASSPLGAPQQPAQ